MKTIKQFRWLMLLCSMACALSSSAQDVPAMAVVTNIPYYSAETLRGGDTYQHEICRLDLRYPVKHSGYPTVVWFHGGGLTGGGRHFINLDDPGIAVVAAGYRLHPGAKPLQYIEDAAAAVAWTIKNIATYGGDPKKVFVAGASAGGYLTYMVGMDPRWLQRHGLSNLQLAGLIPVTGQATTHFNVKKWLGDTGAQYRPVIDEYAPLYYCSATLPPFCIILGDRKLEWKCRVEENELLASALRALGHTAVELHEQPGKDHGSCVPGAMPLARAFIKKHTAAP